MNPLFGRFEFMKKSLFAIVAALSAALAACAAPGHTGMRDFDARKISRTAPSPAWRVPTQLDFTLKHGTVVSAWRCGFFQDGMVRIQSLAAADGEFILVGGHALAVRGAVPLQRDVLEIVDDALLNQQLVTRLLQQASPQGPESVTSAQPVRVDEGDDPIGTETTNTARYFYAPWKLHGELRRADAGGIGFDLQFEAHTPSAAASSENFSVAGIWQQRTPVPQLGDDFPLAGWSIFRIRMGTRDAGGITIAGYVTTADSRRYQTLGELRASSPVGR